MAGSPTGGGDRRRTISVLDVAPSLLTTVFGLEPPESMQGAVDERLFG